MANKKKAGLLNASERDGVQYRKASLLQLIIGMANNGTGVIFYMVLAMASAIAPMGYGIALPVAGMILTATRMVDGVSDAIVAAIFERFNPRKGKVRIMLLIGWAIGAVAAMLLYSWAAGIFDGIVGVIVFIALYLLFDIGNTINGVAGGTVGIVITNDPTQRPMTGVIGTLYSYVTPMILMNINTFVILPKYDNQYTIGSLGEMMAWYSGISLIFAILACIGIAKVDVRETFATIPKKEEEKEEKVSLKDMWSVLKDNRNVQMYMLTGISDKLAQQTMSQQVATTMLGGVLIGSYAATTWVGNISQIVGLFFAFGSGIFVAKWGAKKSTTVWSWINIIVAAACIIMFFILGSGESGLEGIKVLGAFSIPYVIYIIFNIVKTGANMALTTTGSAMRGDLVDYEYERSGKYMPAVVAGVYSLLDKIVSAFGVLIATSVAALVGYVNTIPQIGDKVTWGIFWCAMFLNFGMGILGWLCNVIAMKFYSLDRDRMVEVQKNLAARKEALDK